MPTYGEQFNAALACESKEQADKLLADEVQRYVTEYGQSAEEAERVIKINLGYMAGYYPAEVGDKIYNLFGAAHPVFGRTTPSAEEALQAGMRTAKSA